ncbi:MAG: hypothetical protein HYV94_12275 [Candidatus Rokubacteria bacterium]|nr:hypothetical protein [Candidatus Rokubacteria bacterium]
MAIPATMQAEVLHAADDMRVKPVSLLFLVLAALSVLAPAWKALRARGAPA